MPAATDRRGRPAGGIAMIEALVAILLLSLCALAYAALQLKGVSASSGALWRSKASVLAGEMADRLRANQAGVGLRAYDSLLAAGGGTDCTGATACTPQQMAQWDHAQWSQTLGRELPQGVGVVCLDATPDDGEAGSPACDGSGSLFAVKVFWRERGQPARLVAAVRP